MSKKSAMDKSVVIFFVSVCIIAGAVLVIKNLNTNPCKELIWKITPENITAGQVVYFTDNTSEANSWKWDFGDSNSVNNLQNATHIYEKEGTYMVSLKVNDKCIEAKQIKVNPDTNDVPPVIEAPQTAYVGRPVQFRIISAKDTSWEWSFERSTQVDSREESPSHTYRNTGIKTITVLINNDTKITREIEILSAVNTAEKLSERDFIYKLNQVMKGDAKPSSFIPDICGLNIMVRVNSESPIKFSSYCDRLRITGVKITSVKWEKDPTKNCINFLKIEQQ